MTSTTATRPANSAGGGLVDYKEESSSDEEGEDKYIRPRKRSKIAGQGDSQCF